MRTLRPQKWTDQSGNVTLFFLLLAFVILGALAYSLYIGRTVQEKIRVETAADTATLSMANHTAAGLNMVSVNNLAIAANLHTAAAVPFIGRYYAVARAMMVGLSDTAEMAKLATPSAADGSAFGTGFGATKEFAGLLMKAAAGNTQLNRMLVKSWFLQTLPHGIQTARLNAPGSLPIPTNFLSVNADDRAALLSVGPLAQSTADVAYCHAISASQTLGDRRNSVAFWVRGLLASTSAPSGWLRPLEEFEVFVQSIVAFIDGFVAPVRDVINNTVGAIAGAACGLFPSDFGLSVVSDLFGSSTKTSDERSQVNGLCNALDSLNEAFDAITRPPLPRFETCGISHAGNFAKQSQAFATKFNHADDIGFVYPNITSQADLVAFERSIDHGLILAKPLFLKEELPKSNDGKSTICPEGWAWTTPSGSRHCEALLDGIDFDMASTAQTPGNFETASGGVGAATGTGLGSKAKLRGLLSRTQWAMSEAKAEYHPSRDDPTAATTYDLRRPEQVADAINRTRVQLFWPAWRGRNAPSKALDDVLSFIGTR